MAAPDARGERSAERGDAAARQKMNEIGESWMSQIQGRAPAGENENAGTLRLPNPGDATEKEAERGDAPDADPAAAPSSGAPEADRATAESAPAGAADEQAAGAGLFPEADGPSFFTVVFRFFALMAVMVGLFYLAVRYLRAKTGAPVMGGSDLVQVLVSVPLVQGKFLQIVDVAGKLMVLGVSDAGVQMLESVDDGLIADRIRIWQSRRGTGPVPISLLDRLQSMFRSADFRFWATGEERARRGADFASFSEWLGQQVPNENAREARTGSPRQDTQNQDLFASADPAGGDKSAVPDEIGLKNLLKQQKRRLAAARNKPPEE